MELSLSVYFIPFVLALFFALGGRLQGNRYSEPMFWVILAVMAVLGGARWHTGWDWGGYEFFLSNIPLNGIRGIFGYGYTPASSGLSFEPGYYALSYIVKWLGGTNEIIAAAASVFNLFALSRLIRALPNNRCFSLFYYICFCFIFLHFAMVRQSFAVGFAYLACREVIDGGKLVKAVILTLCGMLFQATALMYLPVLLAYQLTGKKAKIIMSSVAALFIGTYVLKIDMTAALVGFLYNTLGLEFFGKYHAYVNIPYHPSLRTYVLIAFNFPIVLYLMGRTSLDPKLNRLSALTFNATMLMVLAVAVFPSTPSIWRRLLFLAAPLQGVWFASRLLTASYAERIYVLGILAVYAGSSYVYTVLSSVDNLTPYHTLAERLFK